MTMNHQTEHLRGTTEEEAVVHERNDTDLVHGRKTGNVIINTNHTNQAIEAPDGRDRGQNLNLDLLLEKVTRLTIMINTGQRKNDMKVHVHIENIIVLEVHLNTILFSD